MSTAELNRDFWRRCSSCKTPIKYSATYFVCSVSTCNRKRIGYVFDSVHCWERHLPGARHRDAAAVEEKAPTFEQWRAELALDGSVASSTSPASVASSSPEVRSPQRVIARPSSSSVPTGPTLKPRALDPLESEILVVVSKLKNYVRERSDMNTSDSVMSLLSNKLRRICDQAIDKARADGRKTVMDRDFD